MKILGIAGGTASGKTTFSELIKSCDKKNEVVILPIDSYYRDTSSLSFEEREAINFDHPDALELDLLHEHLRALLFGETVRAPVYDFVEHNRSLEVNTIVPTKLLVVDGIFALHGQELRSLYEKSIFIEADPELMYQRRLKRDTEERGRSKESVKLQWDTTVYPMYEEFCYPTKAFADEVIDGSDFSVKDAKRVLASLLS